MKGARPTVIIDRFSAGEAMKSKQLDRFFAALKLVEEQADDEGLWFQAKTAPEAYLQQALRRLRAVLEGKG